MRRSRDISVITQSHRETLELIRQTSTLLALPARLRFIIPEDEFLVFTLPIEIAPYPYYLLHH